MPNVKEFFAGIRTILVYALAVLLLLLILLTFLMFGSPGIKEILKAIPLREGTFDPESGALRLDRPAQ